MIVILTYGVGMLIGAQLAGLTYNSFLGDASVLSLDQWYNFWWIPAIFAGAVMIFFIALFKDRVLDKEAKTVKL